MKGKDTASCPATSTADDNIEQVPALILNNRRVTTDEMANHTHISHGHGYEIIHIRLNNDINRESKRRIRLLPFKKTCWVAVTMEQEFIKNRETVER